MFQVGAGRSQQFAGVLWYKGMVLAVYAVIGGTVYSQTLIGSSGVERCDEEEGAGETLC